MELLGDVGHVCLEVVLVLVQDRFIVCAKRTVALEIVLHALDDTPRWRGSSGRLFRSDMRW
jgi:hypothetical protein